MVWPEERYGGMDDYDIRWEQVIIEELAYACSDWFGSLHSRIVRLTSPVLAARTRLSAISRAPYQATSFSRWR